MLLPQCVHAALFTMKTKSLIEMAVLSALGVAVRPIIDSTGRITHTVAVGADITAKREELRKKEELQRKILEEMKERERMVIELKLAQKLESVGRLAAGIAHEINTPIHMSVIACISCEAPMRTSII